MPRARGESQEEYEDREREAFIRSIPAPLTFTGSANTSIFVDAAGRFANPPGAATPVAERPLPALVQAAIDAGLLPAARVERVRSAARSPYQQLQIEVCPRRAVHAAEVEARIVNANDGTEQVVARMTTIPERGEERYDHWRRITAALYAAWDDVREHSSLISASRLRVERDERLAAERRATAEERVDGIIERILARMRPLDTLGGPLYIDGMRGYDGPVALTLYTSHRGPTWNGTSIISTVEGRGVVNRAAGLGTHRTRDAMIREAVLPWARAMAESGFEVDGDFPEGDDE